MANVIIYRNSNAREMTPGQVITPGENGNFDTVTERWYYGGSVTPAHIVGASSSPSGLTGGTWVCMGLSDIERLPGGSIIATVTWRGLRKATDGIAVTETRGIRETSYDSISGIPGTGTAVQARLLDPTVGLSVRAISKSKDYLKPNIASGSSANTLPGGLTPPAIQKVNQVINSAVVWTFPYGWMCYSWQQEEPIEGFYFVSAEYRYEHQKSFSA